MSLTFCQEEMPGLEKDLDELEYNIWIAAGEGHTDQVIEHLSDVGPDIQDDYGYTPLHAAASYGQDEIVRLLISDYKASVNIQDEQGDTALHLVEEVSTCKLLIELGADPQIRNEEGRLVCASNTAY
jgi:ankyrin repeat protein